MKLISTFLIIIAPIFIFNLAGAEDYFEDDYSVESKLVCNDDLHEGWNCCQELLMAKVPPARGYNKSKFCSFDRDKWEATIEARDACDSRAVRCVSSPRCRPACVL